MSERVQVAVIGAGPAGLSAAIAAASAGAHVVLLDENRTAGGQFRYRSEDLLTDVSGEMASSPVEMLTQKALQAGVRIRTSCQVWGLFEDKVIGVEFGDSSAAVEAERVLLATGSVDRSLPFPGGSSPGVFTARALQILLNEYRVRPGRRFALIGEDPLTSELTRDIERAGGEVVVTYPNPPADLAASGDGGVNRMIGDGTEHRIDIIVVVAGRLPDAGLALMAECAAGYDEALGGYVPKVDDAMETSVPGIFAAGDCIGICDVSTALAEGTFAGICVAASLGLTSIDEVGAARERYVIATVNRAERLARVTGSFVQVDREPMGATAE